MSSGIRLSQVLEVNRLLLQLPEGSIVQDFWRVWRPHAGEVLRLLQNLPDYELAVDLNPMLHLSVFATNWDDVFHFTLVLYDLSQQHQTKVINADVPERLLSSPDEWNIFAAAILREVLRSVLLRELGQKKKKPKILFRPLPDD